MATTGDDFGIYFEEFVPSEDESEKSFELLPRPPISQRNIIEELEMPDLPLRTSSIDNVETQPVTFNFISSGTSKGRPLVQLYTIHAFVKKGDATKQVPLVFIFMSGKSYEDYRTVFNCLTGLFPHQANVAEIVLDYEAAAWKAVRHVFPNVSIKGC